jgi:hypothetical protein
LHNELYDFYCSPDIQVIKPRRKWVGHVVQEGEQCMVLVGKLDRKRHFGRFRWEDNFKVDPIERV